MCEVQSIFLRAEGTDANWVIAELWELGTAGLAEEGPYLRAYFDDSVPLGPVTERLSRWLAAEPASEPDACAPDLLDCEPILVGERFFIAPSHLATLCPHGRIALSSDSTAAFGTGRHETTQLALECLENFEAIGRLTSRTTVVDVGCGSGILSAAALGLGAGQAIPCDIDPLAVEFARNIFGLEAFVASADALKDGSADVLLVNISAKVIDLLSGELQRVSKPDALIVLTGFLSDRTPSCFIPASVSKRDGWLCWTGSHGHFTGSAWMPPGPVQHPGQWW